MHIRLTARLLVTTALVSAPGLAAVAVAAEFINTGQIFYGGSTNSISADGSVIVATKGSGTLNASNQRGVMSVDGGPFTNIGGVSDGGGMFSNFYSAVDVSGDGTVVTGTATLDVLGGSLNGALHAYRWTEVGGFEDLGTLGGISSTAYGISADGKTIVGGSAVNLAGKSAAFRWSEATGMQELGSLPDEAVSLASAASGDGSTIVGISTSTFVPGVQAALPSAFVWTEAGGMQALERLGGNQSRAYDISDDGRIIVGSALETGSFVAVRWVDGEIEELGGLHRSGPGPWGDGSEALGISANGLVIVGSAKDVTGLYQPRAFRWTADDGLISVTEWLENSGATMGADFTAKAQATNADGSIVIGTMALNYADPGALFIARGNGTTGDPGDTGGDDNGGGDTGGGDTGGGDTGGGGTGGGSAGLITIADLGASLGTSGAANTSIVNSLGMIVNGAGSRPLDRRAPVGKFTAWLGGDWGRDEHGSRDGSLGLGELGFGYNFGPVQLNGVAGYTGLDQNTLLGGTTEVRAGYVKLEALGQITGDQDSGLWGIVTGTGLWGNADISRNYFANLGLVHSSSGRTDVEGYGIRGRLQWENAIPHISPYGELSYAHTCLGAYTESGGSFPAAFNELCDSSTEARYGFDATLPITEQFRLLGTLEGVHRFEGSGSNVTGQVIGLGGFDLGSANYQQDWLRAGAGFEVDFSGSTLSVMGNATTKGEASSAWIAANWRVTF